MEDLHRLITVQLVKQGDRSGRARRRAWLRSKNKIVRLRENLKAKEELLLAALGAEMLFALSYTLNAIDIASDLSF